MNLRAYLQLCRLPTVFTALADILLGFLLVHASPEPTGEFVALLLASAGLYLSGMVFNDVFDRVQDARERPNRPIPSGRVSLRAAIVFGSLLMVGGVIAAALASPGSLLVAALLVVCILAYDGYLKRTPAGPLAMGACRFLNVVLGASSIGWDAWGLPTLWVAAGTGLYIVGVTWFARTEAVVSSRRQLFGAVVVVNAGLLVLGVWAGLSEFAIGGPASLLALVVIALTVNRRTSAAIADPQPALVQISIKTMLLSLIMLDATLIFARHGSEGVPYAIITAALLIPAMLAGRVIRMT